MKPGAKIPVKFSEDLAQYADIRPVRRQPMTLRELVGLVLATTGKHPERVREHLRSGTCLYNIYRYWWDGFEIDEGTLTVVLGEFPDPDPSRVFCAEECQWARFYDDREPVPHEVVIEPAEAGRRRWLRRQSFWDFLLGFARVKQPLYQDYSYYHRADIYRAGLTDLDRALLLQKSHRLAPRSLRVRLGRGSNWIVLELGCPRAGSADRRVESPGEAC